MSEQPKLRPCPFCGNEPYSAQTGEHYIDIGCPECDIGFHEADPNSEPCADVLAAWNRRTLDLEPVKALADALSKWLEAQDG